MIPLASTNNLGRVYSFIARFDSTDYFLNRALEIMKQQGDVEGQARILTNLGGNAGRAKDYEKNSQYNDEAYALFSQLNDAPKMVRVLRNTAKALDFYQDAYNLAVRARI